MPAPLTSSRIAAAIERRYGTALDLPADLPNLAALAALNERSVCRRYRSDPVPEEVLRLLYASALAAPTKSDLVPVAGLALGYPEAKEPLSARLALSATVHNRPSPPSSASSTPTIPAAAATGAATRSGSTAPSGVLTSAPSSAVSASGSASPLPAGVRALNFPSRRRR